VDYTNPALAPVDERNVIVRVEIESDVDAVGDARTKLQVKMPPAYDTFVRNLLRKQVVAGEPRQIPLQARNLVDFLDLDSTESLPEDVQADFSLDAMTIRLREIGWGSHRDGVWVCPLTSDPSVPYEIVKKERGRVVTVRGVQPAGGNQVTLTVGVFTLPEGAHGIEVVGKPSRLVYRLAAPAPAGAPAAGRPALRLEAKPHLMSALYRLYGDPRIPKLWAARSAFHNDGAETLTSFQVRYRIPGYADWSAWAKYDFVYPGQTVVDRFRPALDPKVREIRAATPVTVEVEYEYARGDGTVVRESASTPTKLLGFNDGVYTDVEMGPDSPWCELLKGMPWVLASFVSGDDPVMREAADWARRAAGGVSPTDGDQEAKRFLQAVYELMRRNLDYEQAVGSLVDGVPRQYLKYGRDVLRTRKGTCVNTSILFASVAEAAGLEPTIMVVPGHAFVGIKLPKSGQLFFIETTGATATANAPFDRACKAAARRFQEAARSGLFMPINIPLMRGRGVTPTALADAGPDPLRRWKIVPPEEVPAEEGPGEADPVPLDRDACTATITEVRKEPDVMRDGLKGMAFHVHLKINRARGTPCELFLICLDENAAPVRSELKGYSAEGFLTHAVTVTPADDEAEWEDLVLFIPYKAITVGRGTHSFNAVIAVGSDGKLLTAEPTTVPFKITRGR
jgi:hypothetical protein